MRMIIYSELLSEWIDRQTNGKNAGKNKNSAPLNGEYSLVYYHVV
jgi:hypothetical protein